MTAAVEDEVVRVFPTLTAAGGTIDLEQAGIAAPASTWTYLVNDNPFSTIGVSLLASRNIGYAAAAGMLAVMYWPITVLAAAGVFLRRLVRPKTGRG